MNKQDVFEQVDLLNVKPIGRRWKSVVIWILPLAALLVILATAVAFWKPAGSAVSVLGNDSVYANPELNAFAEHARRGEAETAVSSLYANPELRIKHTFGYAASVSNARDDLATNPELKAQQSYASAADLTDARDFLAINPEIKTLTTRSSADISAMRWQAMAQFYAEQGLLTRDDFDYEQAAETLAARWIAMARAYEKMGRINDQ